MSNDAGFALAYAIIMLNTDQHNHNVRKQNIPMTVEVSTAPPPLHTCSRSSSGCVCAVLVPLVTTEIRTCWCLDGTFALKVQNTSLCQLFQIKISFQLPFSEFCGGSRNVGEKWKRRKVEAGYWCESGSGVGIANNLARRYAPRYMVFKAIRIPIF